MLFSLGHGQRIVVTPPATATEAPGGAATLLPPDTVPLSQVLPNGAVPNGEAVESLEHPHPPQGGPFHYFFPDAAVLTNDPDIVSRLSDLAAAMTEADPVGGDGDSRIPPVFTYWGQFIDHDITANTDRDVASSVIDGADLSPLPREQVASEVKNLRKGSLGLDSLYGDGPAQDAFAKKLETLMRHPTIPGKMRLGVAEDIGGRPDLPADPAVDVLRLGRLIDSGEMTADEVRSDAPEGFLDNNHDPLVQKAIIGDGRNDENLIVAQLQVAFLRFHNKVVDWLHAEGHAPSDPDALFEKARELTRWHYQWLVVNAFLPTVCDPAIVGEVKRLQAPLYSNFFDFHAGPNAETMPLPLEFSVAAYRYGHSMVRANYDHNRNFGRPPDGNDGPGRASFEELFQFTGRPAHGGQPEPGDFVHSPLFGFPTLPTNWIIEWERFVRFAPGFRDRFARKIDTALAPPLADMVNEPPGIFKKLAERNLRRGHRLNVPTAQACIADLTNGGAYAHLPFHPLSEDELKSGTTGSAIDAGGFASATPLWFYVLKEAELRGNGERLGPLGSLLVADTLVGLCVKDPHSYWNQTGASGRWRPQDGAKPDGHLITSLESLLEATGQLAPPVA